MIVEIRKYRLKSGKREAFISYFETRNREALREAGMRVFGPMRDLDDEDVVHWLRAFETLEERERLYSAFYDGPVWIDEIEQSVMPLIETYEHALTETTAGFETFDGTPRI